MRITEIQRGALEKFSSDFGNKHHLLSEHDFIECVRRQAPAAFRVIGISGNHKDRQSLKDMVTQTALEARSRGGSSE